MYLGPGAGHVGIQVGIRRGTGPGQTGARSPKAVHVLAVRRNFVDAPTTCTLRRERVRGQRVAKDSVIDAPRLNDQLELAKAIATLDQDAVDDAQQHTAGAKVASVAQNPVNRGDRDRPITRG